MQEGTDLKYGARHLKRALERHLVYPLSSLVATSQVGLGDLVNIDFDEKDRRLVFLKEEGGALIHDSDNPAEAAILEEIFSKNASAIRESRMEGKAAKPSVAKERRG